MSSNDEYLTVRDFALLTGISPGEIQGKFTVEIGNRQLVPRFMLEGRELGEIAHIELPADPEHASGEVYSPIATLELNPATSGATEPLTIRLRGVDQTPGCSANLPAEQGDDKARPQSSFPAPSSQLHAKHKRAGKRRMHGAAHRSGRDVPASPYARFVARMVDLTWETAIVAASALWIISHLIAGYTDFLQSPVVLATLMVLVAPVTLLLDALCHTLAGNTPGKWMLGLQVVSRRLRSLGFRKYSSRNFTMWYEGFAYGIVPVSFLYMARQGVRVSRGMETVYDLKVRTRVCQRRKTRALSILLGTGIIVALLALANEIRKATII